MLSFWKHNGNLLYNTLEKVSNVDPNCGPEEHSVAVKNTNIWKKNEKKKTFNQIKMLN